MCPAQRNLLVPSIVGIQDDLYKVGSSSLHNPHNLKNTPTSFIQMKTIVVPQKSVLLRSKGKAKVVPVLI
jgi:hypothetical protein